MTSTGRSASRVTGHARAHGHGRLGRVGEPRPRARPVALERLALVESGEQEQVLHQAPIRAVSPWMP